MLDRRSLLAGGAALFATTACSRSTPGLGGGGANPLPMPPLLDARPGRSFALRVQS
ncbi:MAG: copper oxidase, partial [Bosea sp. (in: a-proteobacteria)]